MTEDLDNSQLGEVIAQLKSLNFSHDELLDAVDSNNQLAAKNLLINTQAEEDSTSLSLLANGRQLVSVVISMRTMVSEISRTSKELLEFFTANDMQQEENRKDLLAAIRESAKKEKTPKSEKKSKGSAKGAGGLLGILAFAAALVGGTVVGFVTETTKMFSALIKDTKIYEKITLGVSKIGNILKGFAQYISRIAKAATTFLGNTKIGSGIIKIFNTIRTTLSSLFNAVKLIGEGAVGLARESALVKYVTNTITKITEAWTRFTGALRAVGDIIRPLFGSADETVTIGGRLAKVFPNIAKFFTTVGDIFAGFARGFKTGTAIGKGIARLLPAVFGLLKAVALPITIIMGIIATVVGFIKGFKEGGIIGGIKGAIVGLFESLIGGILDMIKGAVSWIASMLGFDNVSKFLDSFSFTDLFKKSIDWIFDLCEKIWVWLTDKFSWETISGLFENFSIGGFLAGMYGSILDTLKGAVSWLAGMLGFDTIATYLDSFSFTDIFKNLFDEIDKAIDGLIDWIMNIPSLITELAGQMGEAIGAAVSNAGSMAEGFAKSILRDVLPDPAASGVLNPMSWVAKAIPDSIYEYAGLKAKAKEGEATGASGGGAKPAAESLTDDQKLLKAKEAGYNSWDDYKSSGWKYKMPTVAPISNTTGAELMNSSKNISVTPVVVNNYGGNTTTNTTSSINNTQSNYDPIMPGSAMGFASI